MHLAGHRNSLRCYHDGNRMGRMKKSDPAQNFRTFYRGLPPALRRKFADEAATTTGYIECHLIYARKCPRKDSFDNLWKACESFGAKFSRSDLASFFFDGGKTLH